MSVWMFVYLSIYCKELAHIIMETKLETQEGWWCSSSLYKKAWEPGEQMIKVPKASRLETQEEPVF